MGDIATPVRCPSCRTAIPARHVDNPPPHHCAERTERRRALQAKIAEDNKR